MCFQYVAVDSIAASVTRVCSQSAITTSDRVIVAERPRLRRAPTARPRCPHAHRHRRLPTSIPATRSNSTSIPITSTALKETPLGGTSAMATDPRAHGNNPTLPRSPHRTLLRALRHHSKTASPSGPTILILRTQRSRSSARTRLAPMERAGASASPLTRTDSITFQEIVGSLIYHGPLTIGPERGASTQHQELPIMAVTCANTSRHHDPIRLSAP